MKKNIVDVKIADFGMCGTKNNSLGTNFETFQGTYTYMVRY
jgi:hypothetical protein